MTAGQSTRHLSNVSLAPAPLAALLAATLMAGAMIGAGITQLGSTGSSAAVNGAAAQPAGFPAYDRALDGAGFRTAAQPAGLRADDRALDGAGFRSEGREILVAKPDSGAATSEQKERRGGK
ncbi:MAG TPA: hypothetical protein VGQ02_06415 [Candidatus Limnocylindrales bacterium]|nr:hypothetical protein [Candidatus Limnocylindrales bacterium]